MSEETNIPPVEAPPVDLIDDFVSSLLTDEPEVTPTDTTPTETPEGSEEELGLDKPQEEEKLPEEKPKEEEPADPETPKNRKDWDTLRASRDRHKQTAEEVQSIVQVKEQTITQLTQQLEELQTKVAQLPELQEKLKDLDSYEKELSVTRLEATREYKETILRPLQVIGEQAAILATANETEEDEVFTMLREPDPAIQRAKLKEITAGWDEMDRAELWNMTKDARVVLDKQDSMRENAAAAAKEQQTLAAQRETEEKAEARKQYNAEAKEIVKSLKEKTPFIALADGETVEDRFLLLAARVAEVDLDTQSQKGKAFAAATAVLYPQMVKTIQKLQEENDTLKSRVKDKSSAKPNVSPSDQTRPPAADSEDFLSALGVSQSPMLSQTLNVVGS